MLSLQEDLKIKPSALAQCQQSVANERRRPRRDKVRNRQYDILSETSGTGPQKGEGISFRSFLNVNYQNENLRLSPELDS
ncbi:hypothetical protein EVAR_18029_1 [Eumeta japonica]|uniref:Uncharacterized protein n=1 Tax=Eumeta variegata TaxID=151549 RepID=A0A4C1XTM2_EUMVA|nr:hypothetical protein EVAR_18029_1 [Eumeta japonica]